MAKIMMELDILSKNVMGVGARSVNVVEVGGANPEEMKFDAMYDEERDRNPNWKEKDKYVPPHERQKPKDLEGEIARPKVAGRNDPPRRIRAREFRNDEKKAELARQRKYTKEAREKRQILVNPNVPPWDRSLVNAIRAFGAAHEIDQIIAANLAAEAKAVANNEDQNNNTPGTIVLLQGDASGTDTPADRGTV
uniref:Uncharacterized protein n=1 Tax=Solanum tuberosum TaxID=4113 RepID=M1DEK9_SOLTU